MDISVTCKISLSKKLRQLIKDKGSVILTVPDIVNGNGIGKLTLSSDHIEDSSHLIDIGETSIMLTPTEQVDIMPGNINRSVASIFTTVPSKGKEIQEPVVKKIASVNAPERGHESRSIQDNVRTPAPFSELDNPSCREFISNLEELIAAIQEAKHKQSNIDPDSASNPRERALMMEEKERAEAIDIPALIVNDKVGNLSINDLDISLPLNVPFDLSNISARRVAVSKELKGLLRDGYVKFISPNERDVYFNKIMNEERRAPQLEVFDNVDQAEANMAASSPKVIDDANAIDVSDDNLEEPTEEENMILDLTAGLPTSRSSVPPPSTQRRSVHGDIERPEIKNPNIKAIRRKD